MEAIVSPTVAKEHRDAVHILRLRLQQGAQVDGCGMVVLTQHQAECLLAELDLRLAARDRAELGPVERQSALMALDASRRFIRYGTRGHAQGDPSELSQAVVLQAADEAIEKLRAERP